MSIYYIAPDVTVGSQARLEEHDGTPTDPLSMAELSGKSLVDEVRMLPGTYNLPCNLVWGDGAYVPWGGNVTICGQDPIDPTLHWSCDFGGSSQQVIGDSAGLYRVIFDKITMLDINPTLAAFAFRGYGITIQNVPAYLNGDAQAALRIVHTYQQNVYLRDLVIEHAPSHGILFTGTTALATLQLVSPRISGAARYGLRARTGAVVTLSGNMISGNLLGDVYPGGATVTYLDSQGLCTLADLKTRLGIATDDARSDAVLLDIISGCTAVFDTYCRRTLLAPAADIIEHYTGAGPYLQLRQYPIIAITEIKEATDYDFDSADALDTDDDYRMVAQGEKGIIYNPWRWSDTPDSIRATYRGGYCAAGITPGTGEHALPADLREAAILQSSFIFKRRDDIGLSAVSFQGSSISKFSAVDLLPEVKAVLDNYVRHI